MSNKDNLGSTYSSIFFVVCCILTIALLIDTSLARISNFITSKAPGSLLISTFSIIVIAFTIGQHIILKFTNKMIKGVNQKDMLLNVINKILKTSQYGISALIILMTFEIFVYSNYHVITLTIITMISYGLSIVTLGILGRHFLLWFRSMKHSVVLLYALSSITFVVSAIFSLTFVYDIMSKLPSVVQFHYANFPYFYSPGSLSFYLYNGYVLCSILSFILMWVATAVFLHHYSNRLGKIRYWIIVTLPLVYFVSQFVTSFLNLFASLMQENPVFFGVLLSVIFPISKAVGGIFFGIGFWTISRTIDRSNIVRSYLVITAVGFILLFVSDQAVNLITTPYPPFGIISVSAVGLSSYLILMGLYYSAISLADDKKLRKTVKESAIRESKLLDSIGRAYSVHEIESKVLNIVNDLKESLAQESAVKPSITDDEIKRYLEQVLTEVKKSGEQ